MQHAEVISYMVTVTAPNCHRKTHNSLQWDLHSARFKTASYVSELITTQIAVP